MNWSWSSFATAIVTVVVLFLPRGGRVRLKALLAVAFVVIGEGILFGSEGGKPLLNALIFLAAGLLLLAEIATSRENPLVPWMWMGTGTVGVVLTVWWTDELIAWTQTMRSWLVIGCATAALLLGVLAVRGHRRATTVRYDRHDLSGF
ncbi:hypothetical protein [Streptomyces sp. AC550_RSS872]|uniref:hypothetical protein n=1 Tax=Streptomyces sp. AC550_RSS872 TaxID=2823689 RepID=UPI001C264DDE|nr:hypothetical protein [Streptomyces sp. AC550_RSS872]